MSENKQVGIVSDQESATTWRCLGFCPEGPFDDGEIMWHFEMQRLETREVFLVSISGPIENAASAIAALRSTAALIGSSVGIPVTGTTVNISKPN